MHSTWQSVAEQTGIFAGKGGFDVTVGEHTQLNGAVISSTATADKNRLDTGTLSFSNIENHAEYEVEHQSAGMSTGGSIGGQFAGNMANGMLAGLNGSGSADSTTKAAVSEGTIVIRDKEKQTQDVADLSRDVANASPGLEVIFDKEKEQNRLKAAQLIGEIGSQAGDIARTQGQIAGMKAKDDPAALAAAREELAKKGKLNPTADEIAKQAYDTAMKPFGTGSSLQQGISAVTAAVQGLSGGNLAQAVSGAVAPYLAEKIHELTTDPVTGKVNTEANLMAHAVLGAVTSYAAGNSALAGASGAAMGEYIAQQLYPGVKRSDLSEEQRQTISALGTLAAGLAGGVVGDSTADVVAGAQAGKNAVENNSLSVKENQDRAKEMAQCQGDACSAVIEKYKKINAEQHESVVNCSDAQACVDKANEVGKLQIDYANRTNDLLEKARVNGGLSPQEQNELSILQVTTIQLEADRTAAIHNALMSGDSPEAKQLAINSLAQVVGTSAAGIAAGVGKAGNHSSVTKDNRLPIPEATVANNGFKIESNPKHTPGAPGSRPSAGVEPKSSLLLFENSIATKDPKIRLSIDNDGNIHRFFNTSKDGSGTYHWSGSTGDGKNALGNRELGSFNKEIKELKGKK